MWYFMFFRVQTISSCLLQYCVCYNLETKYNYLQLHSAEACGDAIQPVIVCHFLTLLISSSYNPREAEVFPGLRNRRSGLIQDFLFFKIRIRNFQTYP
jgi:hypothetical protein